MRSEEVELCEMSTAESDVEIAKAEARLAEIDVEIATMREQERAAETNGDGDPATMRRRRKRYFEERFAELMYAFNSFLAVFWPVSVTLILAALATVYIDDRVPDADGNVAPAQGGGLPQVADESTAGTDGEKAEAALLNALLIVGIITGATFLMVFLYYINCIKVLIAWLCLSTMLLLGFSTSFMVTVAFNAYSIPFDLITFWFFFYNYAIVGILAIFYQKGIPMLVTQCYLVSVSVVMAWILLRFLPEWTSWALLVLLALYDLCAVLTPCGPLRCLIEVSKDNERPMPGLLYEAQVSNNHQSSRSNGTAQQQSEESSSSQRLVAASHSNARTEDGNEEEESEDDISSRPPDRPARPSSAAVAASAATQGALLPSAGGQSAQEDNEEFWADRNAIKLGLGDFVFYSVLIGRSALNGFATFCAVYITILAGLAGTLTLLAVYQKALPALPISIFVGVFFFFITEFLITPMANSLVLDYSTL